MVQERTTPEIMRVAYLTAPHQFELMEETAPTIDTSQALIAIKTCGICPSDVRYYTGQKAHPNQPLNTGHEFAGEIVAIGSDRYGFKPGDRVVTDLRAICGTCVYCQKGLYSACENLRSHLIRGGYCDYAFADLSSLRQIPDHVSYEEASFAEPLACCIHGMNQCDPQPDDLVAIVGTGPIGLMHLQIARHRGAKVVAVDLLPERLEHAKQLGAQATINATNRSNETLQSTLKQLNDGRGADSVIVTASSADAAETGIMLAGKCATVNLFAGIFPPRNISIAPNWLHYQQITVTASHNFTPQTFSEALRLIASGAIDVKSLISHRFGLEEIQAGFEIVAQHQGLKVMIDMRQNNG